MPNIGDSKPAPDSAHFKPRDCYNSNGNSKYRYYSRKEAKSALKKMPKTVNGVDMRTNARVYKCKVCEFFHIGHIR